MLAQYEYKIQSGLDRAEMAFQLSSLLFHRAHGALSQAEYEDTLDYFESSWSPNGRLDEVILEDGATCFIWRDKRTGSILDSFVFRRFRNLRLMVLTMVAFVWVSAAQAAIMQVENDSFVGNAADIAVSGYVKEPNPYGEMGPVEKSCKGGQHGLWQSKKLKIVPLPNEGSTMCSGIFACLMLGLYLRRGTIKGRK